MLSQCLSSTILPSNWIVLNNRKLIKNRTAEKCIMQYRIKGDISEKAKPNKTSFILYSYKAHTAHQYLKYYIIQIPHKISKWNRSM